MYCKNCGKEIQEGTVCSECIVKSEENITETKSVSDNTIHTNEALTSEEAVAKAKEDKRDMIIGLAVIVIIIVVIFSFISWIFSGCSASDDDYISAARNIISKQLKAPSSAIFSNERIIEQDDYDRTIVALTVESQNSFGGYVTNNCYVLITEYNSDDDTFTYNTVTGVHIVDAGFDFLEDTYIKKLKESTNWNKPLE